MNRMQFEIGDPERRKYIINYINSHQGCTKADLEKGLKDLISKKTIYKLVGEMVSENILQKEKKKVNSRDHKLYVNGNNPLVYVPNEIEQFEKAFTSFSKRLKKIQSSLMLQAFLDFKKVKLTEIDTSNISPSFIQIQQLSLERLSIFFRMIDSFLFRCILVWPKQIQDRETLKKLYHIVFTKIADMNMNFIQSRTDSKFSDLDLLIGNYHLSDHVFKRLGGVDTIYSYQEKFKKIGMQKEIEAVIDSLWDIDKEIQQLAYKEPQIYGFNFKYISDGWRTLLELFKEHVGKEPCFKNL